jgi:hypothetical protein
LGRNSIPDRSLHYFQLSAELKVKKKTVGSSVVSCATDMKRSIAGIIRKERLICMKRNTTH